MSGQRPLYPRKIQVSHSYTCASRKASDSWFKSPFPLLTVVVTSGNNERFFCVPSRTWTLENRSCTHTLHHSASQRLILQHFRLFHEFFNCRTPLLCRTPPSFHHYTSGLSGNHFSVASSFLHPQFRTMDNCCAYVYNDLTFSYVPELDSYGLISSNRNHIFVSYPVAPIRPLDPPERRRLWHSSAANWGDLRHYF